VNLGRGMKGSVTALAGLVLLVLTVVGVIAYMGDSVSATTFGSLAFITTTLMVLAAYFGLVRARTAGLFAAVAALLIVAVMWSTPHVKSGQYQAVFLTNGQVYFGHLHNANTQSPNLTNVYYLQSNPANPQNTTTKTTTTTAQAQLSLVKLGNELHGPEDQMNIKANQILFWENLKNDGKVVQAINNQKK